MLIGTNLNVVKGVGLNVVKGVGLLRFPLLNKEIISRNSLNLCLKPTKSINHKMQINKNKILVCHYIICEIP